MPSYPDYVQRGLSAEEVAKWHELFSAAMAKVARDHGDAWLQTYLVGPMWYVAQAEAGRSNRALVGVMTPSVDKGGRYYPLMLLVEVQAPSLLAALEHNQKTLLHLEQLAFDALECDTLPPNSLFDAVAAAPKRAPSSHDSVAGERVLADLRGCLWMEPRLASLVTEPPHYKPLTGFHESLLPKDIDLLQQALTRAQGTQHTLWISRPSESFSQYVVLTQRYPSAPQMASMLGANQVRTNEALS